MFELDPRAGDLRKQRMKIRLQGQPVEILVMLLERPGEIVTREELQKKLWPADTFVDFEQLGIDILKLSKEERDSISGEMSCQGEHELA